VNTHVPDAATQAALAELRNPEYADTQDALDNAWSAADEVAGGTDAWGALAAAADLLGGEWPALAARYAQ
jgi:hypothetical protein